VSGQQHATAALYPGKDPVPILQEAGWAPGPVWTGGKSCPHLTSIYLLLYLFLSILLSLLPCSLSPLLPSFLSVLRALQASKQHQVICDCNIVTTVSRLGFRFPFIASGDVQYKRVHLHRSALLNEAAGGHKSDQFGFSLVSTFVSSATTFLHPLKSLRFPFTEFKGRSTSPLLTCLPKQLLAVTREQCT